MSGHRHYAILLPLYFNNGQPVPRSLICQTIEELEARFGGVSWEQQIVRGVWRHEGEVFQDDSTRLVLDVADTAENRAFFVRFKQQLKVRFQQLDIWLTSQPIEVL